MATRASEAKKYRENAEKYCDNPEMIARDLNAALEKDDLALFIRAMADVIRAQNVVALSKEVGLNRAGLYNRFKRDKDPKLGGILKLLAVLGVELVVKPRASAPAKRPRRKP
jgi:probable addiction module antidote protein